MKTVFKIISNPLTTLSILLIFLLCLGSCTTSPNKQDDEGHAARKARGTRRY